VNRWNFMSFVPNVASIKMAPLWPYDSMDSHWVGVQIPMVNGTWILLISPTSCKKNTSFGSWRTQEQIEIARLVCKCSYVSNPNMQCLEAKWNHLASSFDPHSHVPTKLFYVCHIFVWLCNLSLVGPICDPSMLVTCVEHNETYEKWILGHAHHVQMTYQFGYVPYDKLWFQPHHVYRHLIKNDVRHPCLIHWMWVEFSC
jgi:hypothetical protein